MPRPAIEHRVEYTHTLPSKRPRGRTALARHGLDADQPAWQAVLRNGALQSLCVCYLGMRGGAVCAQAHARRTWMTRRTKCLRGAPFPPHGLPSGSDGLARRLRPCGRCKEKPDRSHLCKGNAFAKAQHTGRLWQLPTHALLRTVSHLSSPEPLMQRLPSIQAHDAQTNRRAHVASAPGQRATRNASGAYSTARLKQCYSGN